ncbi:amidase [Rhodopseudomonas boonkerdii]|uniref:amidase n=1 Tax=Rhodopseudomonas boonkerdii TaxID=475937 RepID=UPI001E404D33|nr:amidase [Rhodopseudomonas boonkerdii]UGV27332.1 amidase [Rhodopseudomonas boonkerdii]
MSDGISKATALHEMSATELIAGYKAKTFSPSEAFEDVLSHIATWEPHLHALYAFDPDTGRAVAKESTARWAKGAPVGPLDGVPTTVKENIATKGHAIPLGTAAMPLVPSPVDAPPAARLREAGAVIFSKTTMPDYGMLSSGVSSFHALTRNPWDLSQNPGGSSAGAGAAAAAGYGPLHLGTDIGGSVRLPAGWCGLATLKPSLGRVPIDPPFVGRCAGPMTRSIDDTALMMSVLSLPDARDGMSLPPADIAWTSLDGFAPKGVRIGLTLDVDFGLPLDNEVRETVRAAAKAFEAAGATVVEVPWVMNGDHLRGLDAFWRARAWDDISKLSPEAQAKILPFIFEWAKGGSQLSGGDVVRGFNCTMAIRANAAKAFADLDYMLSPVAPIVSYAAELPAPTNDSKHPLDHIGYTVPWNMAENPAASINAGYSAKGFPIGLQIAGRRFDDHGVLKMAKFFESIRGPQKPWPKVPT